MRMGKSTGLIAVVTRAQARRENLGATEMAETPDEEEDLGARDLAETPDEEEEEDLGAQERAETPDESSDDEDENQDANVEERVVFPEDGEGNRAVEEPREEDGRILNPQDLQVLPQLLKTETPDGVGLPLFTRLVGGFSTGTDGGSVHQIGSNTFVTENGNAPGNSQESGYVI